MNITEILFLSWVFGIAFQIDFIYDSFRKEKVLTILVIAFAFVPLKTMGEFLIGACSCNDECGKP